MDILQLVELLAITTVATFLEFALKGFAVYIGIILAKKIFKQ